ncbi:MAG: CDGSH iron-sulfur domain-containing protein [Burkholderiales bacterium]
MARIVKRTRAEPKAYIIDGKEQSLCQCGLSRNQPFCDGSHGLVGGEEPGKLYWYDEDDVRHELPVPLPGIRSF